MTDGAVKFLIGFGAGFGLACLFAPKSGEESREFLANSAKAGVDGVTEKATGMWDAATEIVQKGQAQINRTQEGLKNAVEAGRKAYRESAAV